MDIKTAQANCTAHRPSNPIIEGLAELQQIPKSSDIIVTCEKVAEWLRDNKESDHSKIVGKRIEYLEKKIQGLIYSETLSFQLLGYIGFLEASIHVLIESLEPDSEIHLHLANQVGGIKRRFNLSAN